MRVALLGAGRVSVAERDGGLVTGLVFTNPNLSPNPKPKPNPDRGAGCGRLLLHQLDPQEVFAMSPPVLNQALLLSLTQQLGCDTPSHCFRL